MIFNIPGVGSLTPGTPFSKGGYNYPPNWLERATEEDLAALGITVEYPELVAPPPDAPPPAPFVPEEVSPYQARVALLQAGLLSQVDTIVNASGNDALKIAWEYANAFYRHSAFISSLAPALGLTEEQVDQLFIAASQVE